MIQLRYEKTMVYVMVKLPMGMFPFAFDAGSEWAAHALYIILSQKFEERIIKVRNEEYKSGLKDARRKKSDRRSWFLNTLNLRGE